MSRRPEAVVDRATIEETIPECLWKLNRRTPVLVWRDHWGGIRGPRKPIPVALEYEWYWRRYARLLCTMSRALRAAGFKDGDQVEIVIRRRQP